MKRLFDVLVSALALIALLPLLSLVSVIIRLDSRGCILFRQKRVGRYDRDFTLLKFRTMTEGAITENSHITMGKEDPRITKMGKWLRKTKIDELPQLWNVLIGEMSLVGPRPLVREQVEMYYERYKPIFSVRPGLTGNASIYFRNESALLSRAEDPEKYFREVIMPKKIDLNLEYVRNHSVWGDFKLIWLTIYYTFRH